MMATDVRTPRVEFRNCRENFYPDKKMSQRELAACLDVTEHTIRNIETGKNIRVSRSVMRKAAEFFKKPVVVLFPEVREEINSFLA
jgi:transcriptional regulator with XRE-family HTH domain